MAEGGAPDAAGDAVEPDADAGMPADCMQDAAAADTGVGAGPSGDVEPLPLLPMTQARVTFLLKRNLGFWDLMKTSPGQKDMLCRCP